MQRMEYYACEEESGLFKRRLIQRIGHRSTNPLRKRNFDSGTLLHAGTALLRIFSLAREEVKVREAMARTRIARDVHRRRGEPEHLVRRAIAFKELGCAARSALAYL
jgi:hypothetical protein